MNFKQDYCSENEKKIRKSFFNLFRQNPILDDEILLNLGLFIKRQDLSRILFINELYKKIIDVHGVIMEFGVMWGQNMVIYQNLRGIYEPYNHTRTIIGFDTFQGFPSVDKKDGKAEPIRIGTFKVTKKYESYLKKVLDYHEQESPISHIRKYKLIKGDASKTVKEYLEKNPETIIALAYFDFDIYKPTKECLEAIKPHLTKGSILAFDQLNVSDYLGETIALKEEVGLSKYEIKRSRCSSTQSYMIIK